MLGSILWASFLACYRSLPVHVLVVRLTAFVDWQVATPQGAIRVSRVREQQRAKVIEFSRGNELFDKKAFAAALAEYEIAVQIPELKFFAFMNRGNAFKASKSFYEAASCYENALDASSLVSAQGRLLHSCALNNLGALCLEKGSFDQVCTHKKHSRPSFCLLRFE